MNDSEAGQEKGNDLLEALADLPVQDVDQDKANSIFAEAQAAFSKHSAASQRPAWLTRALRVWDLVLEPALATALCLIYLTWAILRAASILGGGVDLAPSEPKVALEEAGPHKSLAPVQNASLKDRPC